MKKRRGQAVGVSRDLPYCSRCFFFYALLKCNQVDQRGVSDCAGGCWGSLDGKAVRVNRVGVSEVSRRRNKRCCRWRIGSTKLSYFIAWIMKRTLTEYHTWAMFLYDPLSRFVSFKSSYTLNLSLLCRPSRHFAALMPTFVMLSRNASKRVCVCDDLMRRECLSHNTPQMCLSPK